MKIIALIIKIVLLLGLLSFALQNTQSVDFVWGFGQHEQWPLVILLLLFFIIGVVAGMLALMGTIFRAKSEVRALKRENKKATITMPSTSAEDTTKVNQ